MYDLYYILYLLAGLVAFGNTCLFIALVMSIEDKKTERKRPKQKTKKIKRSTNKKKKSKKKDPPDEKVGWTVMDADKDGNIIIEEI